MEKTKENDETTETSNEVSNSTEIIIGENLKSIKSSNIECLDTDKANKTESEVQGTTSEEVNESNKQNENSHSEPSLICNIESEGTYLGLLNVNDESASETESANESGDKSNEIFLETEEDADLAPTEDANLSSDSGAKSIGPAVKCQVNLGPSDTTKCCVPNCNVNKLGLDNKNKATFITFPKDPSRFTEWARAINRPDLLTYMNKKENANLLVCSNHFPKNMWINSNTRLKKLHKSAVPEAFADSEVQDDENDDDDVIVISSETKSPKPSRNVSGLKVRKVVTLLSESALREDMLAPESSNATDASLKKTVTTAKWPTFQRKKAIATTEMEKKLLAENNQLKSELDKNMDYILNQKSHYDTLLTKEKEKVTALSNKITQLETEHKKLFKSYETAINTQKSKVNNKEAGQKDLLDKLKKSQTLAVDQEKKINELHATITSMRATNDSLTLKVNEMAETSPPPPPENILQGENFKAFLNSYLRTYKHMKSQVEDLTLRLEDQETEEGQKSLLLRLAAQHLNHGQMAWLQTQLSDTVTLQENEYPDHFREFCISFYEVSEYAYHICMKIFGLAPIKYVEKWRQDPKSDIANVTSTINALFEESQPAPPPGASITNVLYEKELTDLMDIHGKPLIKIQRSRPERNVSRKRKYLIDSESEDDKDDDYDEGKLSDNDEQLVYTSESEEDCAGEKSEVQAPNGKPEPSYDALHQKRTDLLPPPPPPMASTSAATAGPSLHATHQDFDFMMDDSSNNTSMQMGTSMPILVADSPMVPLVHIGGHGRKKIDNVGGNKNIFRVVNS